MDLRNINGAQPYFGSSIDDIIKDITAVLVSGQLSLGTNTSEFERMVASQVGTAYAVAVSSGGTALELALKALNVKDKEVIIPTDTFIASANSVILAGGKPIFADIKRETLCLDPVDVLKKITEKTVGIMLVHMFGLVTPDIEILREICTDKGLFLIEDAAHAHGASYKGFMAGNLGDVACFSYYATKVITTGEGGMVTTDRKDIADEVIRLRNHGKSLLEPVYEIVSNNYRLSELEAVLGIHQMKTLEENVKRRNWISNYYREKLENINGLTMIPEFDGVGHAYWRFPLYLNPQIDRIKFQQTMWKDFKVRITWMYEPLCHLQPVFSENYKRGDMPVAEESISNLICLPTHGGITNDNVDYISESIKSVIMKMMEE